jgi:hypothetical protein
VLTIYLNNGGRSIAVVFDMSETLLSQSNILLFGRIVEDLAIIQDNGKEVPEDAFRVRLATTAPIDLTNVHGVIDGHPLKVGNNILVKDQATADKVKNGIYRVDSSFRLLPFKIAGGSIFTVYVNTGSNRAKYYSVATDGTVTPLTDGAQPNVGGDQHSPFLYTRRGKKSQIQQQLSKNNAKIARIYGFSYEGIYYTIPSTVYFLVHGAGAPANELNTGGMEFSQSRAPVNPSLGGVGAADFELADDIMVWSYDQADYTIRLDVQNGMFEQVLLDAMFGGSSPDVSGMNARGMNARGMNARGMNARGMNARGMNARGGNSD